MAKYKPSKKDIATIGRVYVDMTNMRKERDKSYAEFNDRILKDYIEDSQKRLNGYVLDKGSYDVPKEDWQSNVALPTIRNKQNRMIAGFSLNVADLKIKAFGEDDTMDIDRADVAKSLIKGSYLQEENPVLENFFETWDCFTNGTVIKYEGYLKTKYKQKYIKSYDIVTGDVEFEEREVNVDDKCVSLLVPITEFYIDNYYIYDVQDQPRVAWVRYYDQDVFNLEFGKYPKANYVAETTITTENDVETDFYKEQQWRDRVGEEQIEVIRYYDRTRDEYIIVANGILLLQAPLLWEINGRKVYPFAKAIREPFVGKHFFYGKSFADVLTGEYDVLNTMFNTVLDREFRNLEAPLLIGRVNQDALDLEDDLVTGNTKIYVEDVQQVTALNIAPVNQSDLAMIELVAQGIESSSPSIPDLVSGDRTTAREIVLADEKLKEIKSVYYEFISDLWRQKYALRLANIKINYPQPRIIIDKEGKEKTIFRTFIIDNATLDQATGEQGTLAIQFRDIKKGERKKVESELAIEEEMMKQKGINYKKLIVPASYLDNYSFNLEVLPESLTKTSLAKMQAVVLEKLEPLATYFPQIFVANQEEYFREFATAYDDDPDAALEKAKQLNQQNETSNNQVPPEATQ